VLTRDPEIPDLVTRPSSGRPELTVPITRRGDGVVLAPAGDVDLATLPLFEAALRAGGAAASGTVVLDLARTAFLACCAVGPIARLRRDLETTGRRLVVTGARGIVRRVLLVSDVRLVVADEPGQSAPAGRRVALAGATP
jgi:anti-anti-sigma factor